MMLEKLRTQHAGEQRSIDPGTLVTKWGKVAGLSLKDRDETLGAGHILAASPIADFGDLFGDKRPKRVFQLSKSFTPSAYRYVLNLVISESGIPEGLGPIAFVGVDPKKPLMGDNAFAIYTGDPDEGEDRRTIMGRLAVIHSMWADYLSTVVGAVPSADSSSTSPAVATS